MKHLTWLTKWDIKLARYFTKSGFWNSPDSLSQGWVRQAVVPGGDCYLALPLPSVVSVAHLVVVFHNCRRYWLRVFCRGGLPVPWRFHVWERWSWVRGGMTGVRTKGFFVCGGGTLTCLRGYSLVCGGGGTLCTGLELEDGRVLLPAPWFPPPFT